MSSPDSNANNARPPPPAEKDRQCPYCHTKFTSSSLGRHLDLYIKPRNAKPADGIHNVEEIKRLRGNVTRRQARNSLGQGSGVIRKRRKDSESPLSETNNRGSTRQSSRTASVREISEPNGPLIPDTSIAEVGTRCTPAAGKGQVRMAINKLTWEATGVMNDIPIESSKRSGPPTSPPEGAGGGEDPSRWPSMATTPAHDQEHNALRVERNRAMAAEMALKEVLDSVRIAHARAHADPLFDFPFFQSDFLSVCLHCLKPAPSLGSGVISSEEDLRPGATWWKDPPGHAHLEYLRHSLEEKLNVWKKRRKSSGQKSGSRSASPAPQQLTNGNTSHIDLSDPHQKHLISTYQSYAVLPLHTKQERWQSALASHLAFEQQSHQATKSRLTLLDQEIHALRAQLYTEENTHLPLHVLSLTGTTTPELLPENELRAWNYDTILSRWRDRIQCANSDPVDRQEGVIVQVATQSPPPPISKCSPIGVLSPEDSTHSTPNSQNIISH